MSLTNDERARVIDRLSPFEPMPGIEVSGGNPTFRSSTHISGWKLDATWSDDDRRYSCTTCGSMFIVRGVVDEGLIGCCGDVIPHYSSAPPRPRRYRRRPA